MNLFKTHTNAEIGFLVRQFCAQYEVAFVALNDPEFLTFVEACAEEMATAR